MNYLGKLNQIKLDVNCDGYLLLLFCCGLVGARISRVMGGRDALRFLNKAPRRGNVSPRPPHRPLSITIQVPD